MFELATWHGLAKLRLHTETTVQDLETSTERLGKLLRDFEKVVCTEYETYDLPTEEAARSRRQSRKAAAKSQPPPTHVYADSDVENEEQPPKKRSRRRFYGGREGLIWTITSFIPLAVIQRRFGNMVPLITTTHKPYVNYSLSKAFFS